MTSSLKISQLRQRQPVLMLAGLLATALNACGTPPKYVAPDGGSGGGGVATGGSSGKSDAAIDVAGDVAPGSGGTPASGSGGHASGSGGATDGTGGGGGNSDGSGGANAGGSTGTEATGGAIGTGGQATVGTGGVNGTGGTGMGGRGSGGSGSGGSGPGGKGSGGSGSGGSGSGGVPAGTGGAPPSCVAGMVCQPMNACKIGMTTCTGGVATCVESGNKADGSNSAGSCQPANACKTGVMACSGGIMTCTENGNKTEGSSCGASSTCCGTSCVNKNSDNNNCGTCGHGCTGGTSCSNGTCKCPAGQGLCGGTTCVNLSQPATCSTDGITCQSCLGTAKPLCNNGACVQCTANSQCTPKICQANNTCACPAGTCGSNCDVCMNGQTCQGGTMCGCPSGQSTCNGTCSSSVVSCGGTPKCATWNFETGLQGWGLRAGGPGGTLGTGSAPQHSGNALALSFPNQDTYPGIQITFCGSGADLRGRIVRASIYIDQPTGVGDDPLTSAGLSIDGIGAGSQTFSKKTWTTLTADPGTISTAGNFTTMELDFYTSSGPGTVYVDNIEVL